MRAKYTESPYIVELKIKRRNRDNSEWETLCQRCWNIIEDKDITCTIPAIERLTFID